MTKKQYLELIPLSIFLLAGLSALFKVPYSGLIAVVFGGVTATLYCPLSLWLYASAGVSLINRILIGVAYSLAIVALLFCFLHWANWQFECIMSYGALLVAVVICKTGLQALFVAVCFFCGADHACLYLSKILKAPFMLKRAW